MHLSPTTSFTYSPPSPDFSGDRKMKKPMMEKLRRKRINDSLLYLKEFLLNVSPQQSSKLEKADILEWTVRYLEEQRGNVTAVGDQAAVYRSGREEGFARGFAHASQAVFNYLQMAMPHDFNPQAQQFHLGLVHHLK
ncbi:Helix-loop-helix DNA-binding domain protein [Teladorsagia circumcincta]|uniref:Helix-loop-helix DNA-binding domain protein n=1 Tax=Teladorsagia circumcincta TaxID=45464 RepID=A0A2G9TIV1_TELCI|nr:Helix-loop-helix DNA-binding domain protein [Teladorsagia circumcincta]